MSKRNFQFFTTDQNLIRGTWFPMDHFFYAECRYDKKNGSLVEKGVVVYLEAHANINMPSGRSVSVVQGEGEKSTSEEVVDYPTALRRMADIIEAYHAKKEP
jgi:hypothetical protein